MGAKKGFDLIFQKSGRPDFRAVKKFPVPTYLKCSSNHVYEWTRPAKLVAHINVSRNYLQTAFFNAVVLLALMEFAAQVNANSLLSQIEQIELR